MTKKLNCIMLIDDSSDDNFFHERVIRKGNFADIVLAQQTGMDALNYLKAKRQEGHAHPELIFLDINMPGMNGWEFLEEYNKLDEEFKSRAVVIMLTTSSNPDDKAKAEKMNVTSGFKTKPLTEKILEDVINEYFK